ncbi:MAG: hypothetical protein ACI89U_001572 [Gammaproteobacteria bacterium]|jgi:uncharacterized protein YeaC (DUF1315 family)
MDFEQIIDTMTPEIHENLKRAIEIGKWANGVLLTQQQKESCMEAVISYEEKFLNEQERVGYIDRGRKEEGEVCETAPTPPVDEEITLKWS